MFIHKEEKEMKNIITILLILIVPVCIYLFMSKNSQTSTAIAKQNNPSILIFTSTMCMDCQKMKGVIKEVEGSYNDKINFIYINATDKNKRVQENIKKYHVVLVPTLIFTDENGKQTNKVEGFIPKEELINELEEAING